MPKLSFYEGYSELSFCLVQDDIADPKFFTLPYPYLRNVYRYSFDKATYYSDVFEIAGQELGVDPKNCEISTVGLYAKPEIPFNVVKSDVLTNVLSPNSIYFCSQLLIYGNLMQSFVTMQRNKDFKDYIANCSIYEHIIPADQHELIIKDTLLRDIINCTALSQLPSEVIASGERLRWFNLSKAMAYLLILDSLRVPGTYFLKADLKNTLPHNNAMGPRTEEYTTIGSIINSPGRTECLYKTEVGTLQLITLDADKVFVVPLSTGDEAHVLVKNPLGQTEKAVYGGELGVVIDTRNKSQGIEFKEVFLNVLVQALEGLV